MRRAFAAALLLALVATACGDDGAGSTTTETVAPTASVTTLPPTTTSIPAQSGTPFILYGERGAYVTALQFLLGCAGFGPVGIDGMFGDETAAAVEKAQSAEGKSPSGEPDEETFAFLGRACDQRRTVNVGVGETTAEVAGNVAAGDDDLFELTVLEGQSMTVGVTAETPVDISVQGADGTVLQRPGGSGFTVEIPITQVYTVRVMATPPTSYLLSIEIPALPNEPFEAADWIGLEYQGDLPESLEVVSGQCAGVDMSCDYGVTVAVRPGVLGPLGGSGTVHYLALLELSIDDGWRIVDAETVRVEGEQLITAVCFTKTDDAPAVGIWDYPDTILHAFVWDLPSEDLSVVSGDQVICQDPADNE
jgi:peptidoglycan hydrolase-like protein with peptidoglycan-binding domain